RRGTNAARSSGSSDLNGVLASNCPAMFTVSLRLLSATARTVPDISGTDVAASPRMDGAHDPNDTSASSPDDRIGALGSSESPDSPSGGPLVGSQWSMEELPAENRL